MKYSHMYPMLYYISLYSLISHAKDFLKSYQVLPFPESLFIRYLWTSALELSRKIYSIGSAKLQNTICHSTYEKYIEKKYLECNCVLLPLLPLLYCMQFHCVPYSDNIMWVYGLHVFPWLFCLSIKISC